MTDNTEQHKASTEQWAAIEQLGRCTFDGPACILELRARVEALEAGATCPHVVSSDEGTSYCALAEQTQDKLDRLIELDRALDSKPTPNDRQIRSSPDHFGQVNKMVPASPLVERVVDALANASGSDREEAARAAIREVAAAVRAKDNKHWDPDGVARMVTWEMVAQWLEQEANR